MLQELILTPPVAFLIIFGASVLFAAVLSRLALRRHGARGDVGKAYACGEDVQNHRIQPDYGQFFPFAFFFTILHFIALMAATVPVGNLGTLAVGILYIAGAVTGLGILLRR